MISKIVLSFLVLFTVFNKIFAVEEYTGPVYQAALNVYFEDDHPIFCAGSLISQYTVLTAAGCLVNENYQHGVKKIVINLGQNNLNQDGDVYAVHERDHIIIHPDFNPRKEISNDIALIRLPKKIPLHDKIKTIDLDLSNQNHVNEKAIVSGWGHKEDSVHKLRFGNVAVISNEECSEKITKLTKYYMCAKSSIGDDSVCYAELGGALVSNGKQIGIALYNHDSCRDPERISGYLRLSEYEAWIKENSAQNILVSNAVFLVILAAVFWQYIF